MVLDFERNVGGNFVKISRTHFIAAGKKIPLSQIWGVTPMFVSTQGMIGEISGALGGVGLGLTSVAAGLFMVFGVVRLGMSCFANELGILEFLLGSSFVVIPIVVVNLLVHGGSKTVIALSSREYYIRLETAAGRIDLLNGCPEADVKAVASALLDAVHEYTLLMTCG